MAKGNNNVQHNAHVVAAQNAAIAAAFSAPPAYNPAPAPVAVAPVATGKGAATAARWFKASMAQSNPFAGLTPAQAKARILALPANTVIAAQVTYNPKGGASAPVFALYFGTAPKQGAAVPQGAQTTLGAILAAGQAKQLTPAVMAGHLAWDLARNFIALQA